MALLRWLHISDLHVGSDRSAQEDMYEKIVNHVRDVTRNDGPIDFIFVTGDIANKGLKKEYRTFRSSLYQPLMDVAGADCRFFSVPGNHDLMRPPSDALDPTRLTVPGEKFFDPTKDGKRRRDQVIPRFKFFKQLAPCDANSDWVAKDEGAFTEVIDVRGLRIGLAGINTAWLSAGAKDKERLSPGLPIVENALRKVKQSDVRIVLGHHPINWLVPEHQTPLRALFGEYGVVYLHGHLHKPDTRKEDGAGREFLPVQAGAAFQTRNDDPVYKNGLLWGELDGVRRKLRLSPRVYNADNRDWPTEAGRFPELMKMPDRADWWEYPLPGPTKFSPAWNPPRGWSVLDTHEFDKLRREISPAEAEQYFDGAEPDWTTVLSPKLPQRAIVEHLVHLFTGYGSREVPLVTLLTGPSGEGKSTACRQVVVNMAAKGWRVLWRQDVDAPLPGDVVQTVLNIEGPWLVATDAADLHIDSLHQVAMALAKAGRADVQFLLCARSSDWNTSGANLNWSRVKIEPVSLSGIDNDDALLIAGAWKDFGSLPAGRDAKELAADLVTAARREATLGEGALLGGVLVMRRGAAGLRAHVKKLLVRLGQVKLRSGRTLEDAAAYIAAMHAENLDFLSREVLAQVLGCSSTAELATKVIHPLGREAVASGGTFVRTRHRRIAAEIVDILRGEFGIGPEDVLLELAQTAVDLRKTGTYIPKYANWEYELPSHFLAKQDGATAIRISRAILDQSPSQIKLAVHLAHIYREAGEPQEGAALLENIDGGGNRGYLHEWATCAGAAGDSALSAWLDGLSIADIAHGAPPDNDQAKVSLAGLSFALKRLEEQFNDSVFRGGLAGCVRLGETLRMDEKTKSYFDEFRRDVQRWGLQLPTEARGALAAIQAALDRAYECCDARDRFNGVLSPPQQLGFTGLAQLVGVRS